MAGLRDEIRDIARFNHIVSILVDVGLHDFVERLRLKGRSFFGFKLRKEDHVLSTPEKLRTAFEKLGPTFIKFGQLLSVRPDLVPKEYILEFTKLQDNIAPVDFNQIKQVVESELGGPLGKFFKHFDEKPLSAASIAQVHLATLKNGQKVAVKVQRPKIKETIEHDLHILFYFARLIEKHVEDYKKYSPREVVEEFNHWITKELDFFIEARNAERFYNNFKEVTYVKIPKVYWKYSTKKVLTLEYIDGKKLKETNLSEGAKRQILARLTNASLKQVVEDGFFHADPHPGNILILPYNKIGFVDFGIVGNIDDKLKEQIASLLIAISRKDIDSITNALLDINIADSDINLKKLRQDIRENLNIWYVKRAKEYAVEDLLELTKLSSDNGIKLPIDFILLTKQFLTLDGVCQILDPNYYFIEQMEPYLQKFIEKRNSFDYLRQKLKDRGTEVVRAVDKLPGQLTSFMHKLERGKITFEIAPKELREVERLAGELEKAGEKLALSIVMASLVVGAALFSRVEKLPLIFGWPMSNILFLLSAIFGFWMIISILRGRR